MSDVVENPWRSISTAPKDCYVDVFASSFGRITNVYYDTRKQNWYRWYISDFDCMDWVKIKEKIFYWMPIPPNPPDEFD